MRYRRLGTSDLLVSEISFGSWLTVGVGIKEREAAAAIVDRAFELGITFFDTANVYGRGAAEELLGDLLAARPRDSYVLATKLYFPMSDDEVRFLPEVYRFFILNYVVREGARFFRPDLCTRFRRDAVRSYLPALDTLDASPLLTT